MVPLDPTPWPLDHVLRGAADDVALIDREGTMTFAQGEAAVGAMAAWLAARLAPGDRVATWLPKTRVACLMPLAAARAGLVHVPVNPALRRAQVAHILGDSGAGLVVTQDARAATMEAGDVPTGCSVVDEAQLPPPWGRGSRSDALARARDASEDVATEPPPLRGWMEGQGCMAKSSADPASLAAILYTSGSTGRPKGVMLSHANLWLGAVSVAHYLQLTPADRVLAVLPLSFDYGQSQLLSTWYAGASVAPLDYMTPRDVVKAVDRYEATTLAGVPPLWVQLLEAEWPTATAARLRRLTNTGGALTPRLVRSLRSRFPQADLFAMYGLTEAFRSTYLPPALIDANPESIGTAIPFAEVMVVRADGERAGAGEPGELVHAGPLVAQGYWQDAERTAQRFRPAPAWSASGGLAAWSGDTVVAGADRLIRFVGRDDEMIKSAGNRISPQEIEEAVLAGGEVREAVALGVPDERLGQAVVVVVTGDAAREVDLRARLRTELPSYQQPQRYEWREALPRNANGKLDRAAIRDEVVAKLLPGEGQGAAAMDLKSEDILTRHPETGPRPSPRKSA
ncbi:acyl-CoA ligase (AMP-forming), exosortase A system-associated [Sphingomonas sp.]|jgi:acyl-CoA ligase (AMP-forming) (exosortase A-associated)|uniref:acyl-CoA ligase (AMP-forming), exosortase A system-associated n=1 Tax=Sphingomonas sp. TaxID=28214 RepID=UPI002D7E4733|nr:acyl-CoA ligase (AMP-forming), exosortase A system-associated [Sphingomonas sp.]HEU0043596.1 acyl-CoA ligase (AMP-forming), exosortase A system-associated [Sphingomonas sp.]